MLKIKNTFFILFVLLSFVSCKKRREQRNAENASITINGEKRDYLWYEPSNLSTAKIPLLFCFHGGGGSAKNTYTAYGFNDIAEREKFIVVYPNGFDKNWNDGRNGTCIDQTHDDAKFISELLVLFATKYNIDTTKIFATGMSNGAIFSNYLAHKLPGKFKAIAPVCGSISEPIANSYSSLPCSVIMINGTDDELVKYEGGFVTKKECRGKVISVDETLSKWKLINQINSTATVEKLPNIVLKDDCSATRYNYIGGVNNTKVSLIKVEKGGHQWPGKNARKITSAGNKCEDFNASEVIWDFFKTL